MEFLLATGRGLGADLGETLYTLAQRWVRVKLRVREFRESGDARRRVPESTRKQLEIAPRKREYNTFHPERP